ncbi:MAG: 5'-nucleotidase C-terminal domain-containing protein, partial [Ilumatobacteraceae bacterium]
FDATTCKPLDRFGEYRVAVNDYIAQGGSGFSVLKRNTTKFNTGISLRDALVDFIRTLPGHCDPAAFSNVVGVTCKDDKGETYDCTNTCCGHDAESGAVRCSKKAPQFLNCQATSMSPEVFDYSNVSCLIPDDQTDPSSQAHDGRIQTTVGGSQ